ncbi:hypothetical protein BJ912DRAFT_1138391 [Pholiota molesta]|nr:hypothetical protein BJ912DRAFT_1138391 [Pholiota molesta]
MHLAPPRSSSPPRPHSCSTTPPPRWRLSSSKSPRPRRRWTPTHAPAPAPAEQPKSATPAASAEVMRTAASVAAASLLGPLAAGDDLDLDAFRPRRRQAAARRRRRQHEHPGYTHIRRRRRRQPDRVPDGSGAGGRDRGEAQQDCRAARKEVRPAGRPDRERDARARGGPVAVARSEGRRAQADTAGAGRAARRRVVDPGARDVSHQNRRVPSSGSSQRTPARRRASLVLTRLFDHPLHLCT